MQTGVSARLHAQIWHMSVLVSSEVNHSLAVVVSVMEELIVYSVQASHNEHTLVSTYTNQCV